MHINIKEREKWKLIDMLEKDGVFYKYIYEKLYISNYGNVKKIINGKERYCKITFDPSKGYNVVSLMIYDKNIKKQMTFLVHRLVATYFVDKIDGCDVVNHINANKKDNFYKNLEWTTTKGNMIHASKNGLCHPVFGENHYISKLHESDIYYICDLINKGYKNVEIAKIMNNNSVDISRQAINQIRIGKSWKHITNKLLKTS